MEVRDRITPFLLATMLFTIFLIGVRDIPIAREVLLYVAEQLRILTAISHPTFLGWGTLLSLSLGVLGTHYIASGAYMLATSRGK
jgi:hypothetical protein